MPKAPVAKVTEPEYFSHHWSPKAHLSAEFREDRAANAKIKMLVSLEFYY